MIDEQLKINFATEIYKKSLSKKHLTEVEKKFVAFMCEKEDVLCNKLLSYLCEIEDMILLYLKSEKVYLTYDFDKQISIYFEHLNLQKEAIHNVFSNFSTLEEMSKDINAFSSLTIKKHFGFKPEQESILLKNKDILEIEKEIGKLNKSIEMNIRHMENHIINFLNDNVVMFEDKINVFFDDLEVFIEKVKLANLDYFSRLGKERIRKVSVLKIIDCFDIKDNVTINNILPPPQKLIEVESGGIYFEKRRYDNIKAKYSVKRRLGHEKEYVDFISGINKINVEQKLRPIQKENNVAKQNPNFSFDDITLLANSKFDFYKEKARKFYKNIKEKVGDVISSVKEMF